MNEQGQKITIGKKANEYLDEAKKLPAMKRLLDTLLLEGTLNIWGGDNGVGKSLLAYSLAAELCQGNDFLGMENEMESLRIAYYDFELTGRGLLKRYTNEQTKEEYRFPDNLIRYELNPENYNLTGKDYDDALINEIRNNIKKDESKLIIVDNLTALKSKSPSDTDIAITLMNELNKLKNELQITILILAHITKIPKGKPIEKNHLAGSKIIQNLCDGMIGIAGSTENEKYIYLKELKNRFEEEKYGKNNVIVCNKIKRGANLTVEFVKFDNELFQIMQNDNEYKKVLEMHKNNPDYTYLEISNQTGIGRKRISRMIKKLDS